MVRQSFLKGTIILIIANAISKILGAVFKIPLTYVLKEEGMAIFNTAFSVYSLLLSFVISGFPLAISNITAKHYALKNYPYIKRVSNVSSLILAVLGMIMTLIMFFGASFFAYAMKDPKATLAIKVISPSIFFVALSTVYKGYFQGSVNMIPTAISQVTESLIRLLIGYFCAYFFIGYGTKFSAAGAIFGITFGEILATLMLFLMYFCSKKRLPKIGENFPVKVCINELLNISIPMFLTSIILSGLNMIDTSMVRNALLNINFSENSAQNFVNCYSQYTNIFTDIPKTLKMSIDGARWLYGAYSGYALTIFNLPAGIIGALGVSILPIITGSLAVKNFERMQKTASLALKITNIIAFPFAFGMFFFSNEVLSLLFNNTASAGLLSLLAPCLIFVCIEQLFGALLHSAGFIISPAICAGIGIIIKIVSEFILIPIPQINIYGAPLSSCIAFFVIMVLYGFLVKKHLKFRFLIKDSIIKPFLSAILMTLFILYIITPLKAFLGDDIGFIVSALSGGLVYLLILVLFKCITKEMIIF